MNQNPHAFVWFALEPSQRYLSKETNIKIAKEYEPLLTGKIIDSVQVINAGLYLMIGSRALWLEIMSHQFTVSCRIVYSCGGFLYHNLPTDKIFEIWYNEVIK